MEISPGSEDESPRGVNLKKILKQNHGQCRGKGSAASAPSQAVYHSSESQKDLCGDGRPRAGDTASPYSLQAHGRALNMRDSRTLPLNVGNEDDWEVRFVDQN